MEYINSLLGCNHCNSVSSIKSESGILLTNTVDTVNAFTRHFSSLPTSSSGITPHQIRTVDTSFQLAAIAEEDVYKALSGLDEKRATGSDRISARLLRMTASVITKSLTSLFNSSLQFGQFPRAWKEANVSPVPKGGDKEKVKNYRPVSVIPVIAKVFESLVHCQLYQYL